MGKGGDDREYHWHHEDKDSFEDHGGWFSHDSKTPCSREDDGDKHWTPKPGDDDGFWESEAHHGEHDDDDDDDEDEMSHHKKLKIIAGTIVAAAVLIAALIIIIVVCCKKKAKRVDDPSALKKKNPFQADPEKAMQKPSAKEIEANQSAPPMLHIMPVVVKPVVLMGPLPTDQKGEKTDYTAPPAEDPRQVMALWSPPPAYEEKMPSVN